MISVCAWVIVRLLCSALYSNFQGGHCLTHVGTEGGDLSHAWLVSLDCVTSSLVEGRSVALITHNDGTRFRSAASWASRLGRPVKRAEASP
jgi:hypothetical protein